jgi:hypothetical protein
MNKLLCYKVFPFHAGHLSEVKNMAPGSVYFSNAIEAECGAESFCSVNPLDGLALQL